MNNVNPRLPGFVVYENGGYDRELAKASVGAGWVSLIDTIFDKIDELGKPVRIVQVKEKFAGLRVYTDIMHDEIDKLLQDMELLSFKMCDVCGQPGKVRGKGWYYTSCEEHMKPGDTPHSWQPGDPYPEDEHNA